MWQKVIQIVFLILISLVFIICLYCTNPEKPEGEEINMICSLYAMTFDGNKNYYDGSPLKIVAKFIMHVKVVKWVVHGQGFKLQSPVDSSMQSQIIGGEFVVTDTVLVKWTAFDSVNGKDTIESLLGQRDSVEIFVYNDSMGMDSRAIEISKRNIGPKITDILYTILDNTKSVGLNRLDSIYEINLASNILLELKVEAIDYDSTGNIRYEWSTVEGTPVIQGKTDTLKFVAPAYETSIKIKIMVYDNFDITDRYYLQINCYSKPGCVWVMNKEMSHDNVIVKYSSQGYELKRFTHFTNPSYLALNKASQEVWISDIVDKTITIMDFNGNDRRVVEGFDFPISMMSLKEEGGDYDAFIVYKQGSMECLRRIMITFTDSTAKIIDTLSDFGCYSEVLAISRRWDNKTDFFFSTDSGFYFVKSIGNDYAIQGTFFSNVSEITDFALADETEEKQNKYVWVCDRGDNKIKKFNFDDPNNSIPVKVIHGFVDPIAIAYSAQDSSVWVADQPHNGRVIKIPNYVPNNFNVKRLNTASTAYDLFDDSSYVDSLLASMIEITIDNSVTPPDTTYRINNGSPINSISRADSALILNNIYNRFKANIIQIRNLGKPVAIEINNYGECWIVDKDRNSILKYNKTGNSFISTELVNPTKGTIPSPDFIVEYE